MNRLITIKGSKTVLVGLDITFLLIHTLLLALFWINGVTPMAHFNIFSIVFYVLSLGLVFAELFGAFIVGMYLEVLVHMGLAVYFVGWDSGFQITLIGMIIILFFAEYVGRSMATRHVHALPLGMLGAGVYLGSLVVGRVYPPPYQLPEQVAFFLQVVWGIAVFGIGMFCLQLFVTVTFESEKLLSSEAYHDALTGLPNRYRAATLLQDAIAGKSRGTRWVAIADIDDFKKVNDTYGHNCGDAVLKEVAGILAVSMAPASACRWGGEEFLLIGSGEKSTEAVADQLDGVRDAIAKRSFWFEETRFHITITIGFAPFEAGLDSTSWVAVADEKLYVGKTHGKNQVVR